MFEQLNDAGIKVDLLTNHSEKAEKELEKLWNEVTTLKNEKADLEGKLKMVHSELSITKASLNRINT